MTGVFARSSPAERNFITLVALAVVAWLVEWTLLSPWLIEDAAISLSYARNLAQGEGFVPTPGAEVVEGFSNPLWTILLAAVIGAGLSGWTTVKLLGIVGGVGGLLVVAAWSRRLVGPRPLAALAPWLLATQAPWVIWRSGGLENPLFDLLLLGGALTWMRERESGGTPWSAVCFGLLAVTRPEGIAYGAVMGLFVLGDGLAARGLSSWRRTLLWAVLALAPWCAWEGVRLVVFSWPHPNTYYAKVDAIERSRPFDWDARSWTYTVRWAWQSGALAVLPLVLASLVGVRGRRAAAAALAVVLAGALALTGIPALEAAVWTGREPQPLEIARTSAIGAAALCAVLLSIRDRESVPRTLAAAIGLVGLAFAVWSGGDWMTGFRWMSPVTAPLALLVTDGLGVVAARWPSRERWWTAWALVPSVAGIAFFSWFLNHVDTTPFDIGRRVQYHEALMRRLDLRHALVLDIDQGGNQWWGDEDLLDLAGLNDVAVAHHEWQKPFMEEYAYGERLPDIAHIHGSWADQTRFVHLPGWRRYVPVPPYPVGRRTNHPGTFVHELHVFGPKLSDSARTFTRFGQRLAAVWEAKADEAVPGGHWVIEGHVERVGGRALAPFRLIAAVVQGDERVAHDLAPGWDLVAPEAFRSGRSVRFHAEIPIPETFPLGPVDVALLVVGADGAIWPSQRSLPGAPRFADGEALWRDAARIVGPSEGASISADDTRAAMSVAASGACERAVAHVDAAEARSSVDSPEASTEIGRCYAARAESATGAAARESIAEARRWAHRDAVVRETGRRLANRWQEEGDAAFAAGDALGAHVAWTSAMVADPTRTALRRRIEAERDVRLDIVEQ
jgi:hypothetical protein